jgi:hypothetical protein
MIVREYPYQPVDLVPPVAGAESSHALLMTTSTSVPSVPYIDEVRFLITTSPAMS